MSMNADFDRYIEFVDLVTSEYTKNTDAYIDRIKELKSIGVDVSRLTTAAIGMSAEAGEFTEIVKKMLFQGKPWTEENKEHLIVELGDVMWYMAQACIALGVRFDDVAIRNSMKLAARYPEGEFRITRSENRAEGDI
jgi:NTP pyrophosphatase (non-canonical NTP hydrolase)